MDRYTSEILKDVEIPEHRSFRTILRWQGSKRGIAPALAGLAPSLTKSTYFEPFAGSASLFFYLQHPQSVISDINEELISFYKHFAYRSKQVLAGFEELPVSSQQYYRIRARDPRQLTALERTVRFLYLNRHSFNGVYRVNRNGLFNVPFGQRCGSLPKAETIRSHVRLLRQASIVHSGYYETLNLISRGDFAFIDPPYQSTSRNAYGEYGYNSFRQVTDLEQFVEYVHTLDRRKVKFMVSYADNNHMKRALKSFKVRRISVRRQVAASSSHRMLDTELIITNY